MQEKTGVSVSIMVQQKKWSFDHLIAYSVINNYCTRLVTVIVLV
jgi:hypothetical protein